MKNVRDQKDYWLKHFEGELPVLNLPLNKLRPAHQSVPNISIDKVFDEKTFSDFQNLIKGQTSDLFSGLLSLVCTLLFRYTGQEDFIIGNTSSALRLKFSGSQSFEEILAGVTSATAEAEHAQPFSLEQLFQALKLNSPVDRLPFTGFSVTLNDEGQSKAKPNVETDLQFSFSDNEGQLRADISYNSEIYEEYFIEQIAGHIEQIIQTVATFPSLPIQQLDYLNAVEKEKLTLLFNDTDSGNPTNTSIVSLFEEQVQKTPAAPSLTFGNTSLTYQELNAAANQFAAYLTKNYKVSKVDLFAVQLERSEWMIITILGILKAGGAYVPIDPLYAQERIDYMIENSGCKLVIDAKALQQFKAGQQQFSVKNLNNTISPSDLVYVIYTSGSTGLPKGCALTHRNLSNYILWANSFYFEGFTANFGLFTSLSFDLTVTSIFCPLTQGGMLQIFEQDQDLSAIFKETFAPGSKINSIKITPSHISMLKHLGIAGSQMKCAIVGGEEVGLSHVGILKDLSPDIKVFNEYGPTEATVGCIVKELGVNSPVLIGRPIANTRIYILDTQAQLSPTSVIGEICIAGTSLSRGYLNNEKLTAEKFIAHPMIEGERIYKTGDLGRWLPDGEIEFFGRKDEQVKIRGYRIELGEIETVLQHHPEVESAVVLVKTSNSGDKKLVAYLVAKHHLQNNTAIRDYLTGKLPEYMLPATFIWLNEMPKTTNGKVNKKALPEPDNKRPELSVLFRAAKTELEKNIAKVWGDVLDIDAVGIDDNFFELGGNSLVALKTVSSLKAMYGLTVPITKLYQYPTIGQLADYSGADAAAKRQKRTYAAADPGQPIAIIGMAGKFPGANTIDELWKVLREGKETTRFFTEAELDHSIPAEVRNDPDYVKARGIVEGADQFDAEFFGLNPRLASMMDPQQRLFLQISRDVLEKSGHLPSVYDGIIGVFAGSGTNTYYTHNVIPNTALVNTIGAFQVSTVNEKDYISSRTAYQLDLKGPAVSVFSACSTSLLAIAQAVESLRKNQCDIAIAGGASVTSPINSGHIYQEGAMLSKDGHCRSFDADATGTVFSDGAGVVLLKTLAAAEADGDVIYGLIKGTGVNNDGGGKGSFTAPNTDGQSAAIEMAIREANVDPATISYVETHGTATPLGDPIEIEGLKQAFGEQQQQQYCAIGSIKSNMGHLTAAAGVAGVIKTVLALYHKEIPPSINFERPNPNIDFINSPFYVNNRLKTWDISGIRRAGVSSFGVGGTNVHVIMEEYGHPGEANTDGGRPKQLFSWSAKTRESLEGYANALKDFTAETQSINLADAAYTLQTTRTDFIMRRFAVAGSAAELQKSLEAPASSANSGELKKLPGETVFLFPGQGAQYLDMGAELYQDEPVFKTAIDECAAILTDYLDKDIRDIIYAGGDSSAEAEINNTKYTQPALFVTEYALAKLWISWGIAPTILCGHSIGEYVAAHLAGIFSLADGLKLIATRGKLVSEVPKGSMLSVRRNVAEVALILPDTLSVAAVNSDKLCVVAGTAEEIDLFCAELDTKEILYKKLLTSHAFHSHMMDPVVPEFLRVVNSVVLNKPQKPIVSTVTGNFLTDAEAQNPAYWANHLRQTVQFSKALDIILELEHPVLIESGPGNVCTTLVWQHNKKNQATAVASLDKKESGGAYDSLLNALGKVWIAGLNPDWKTFYQQQQRRRRIDMPTYAYHQKQCWVAPVILSSVPQYQYPADNQNSIITNHIMRKDTLIEKIKELLEDASGIEMDGVTPDLNFVEIGLDSLLLTQVAIILKKEFSLPITFRQLNEEYGTIDALASYIDQSLPQEVVKQATVHFIPPPPVQTQGNYSAQQPQQVNAAVYGAPAESALGLIAQQLQLLSRQVELLTGGSTQPAPAVFNDRQNGAQPVPAVVINNQTMPRPVKDVAKAANLSLSELSAEEQVEIKKPFGATAKIERVASVLEPEQQAYLSGLIQRYNERTKKSKDYTQANRAHMADPRVVSGFRPATKELVYSIVINKSKGSRFWDIDGNEYIDALNGFGSNMLGYQPEVIKKALLAQIENGYEIGPQHELAGEVTKLICEFTNSDRAALCNTGSEAVLGAMRIARTVTGRSLIVAFAGAYHGIVDEVIARGSKKLKTFPAAPGILPEAVQNMLILEYGTDESLQIIKERAHELAAVLVEPVQSRRPDFQPIEFLKAVRTITEDSGTALIFDEVISGFRFHQGGTQALFGIQADLGTYGKVAGAGISIGIIAGKKNFMDALDGGFWQYGDNSIPEAGVTYFAGTFVRHPLALASAKAALLYMRQQGPQLQESLNEKTKYLAHALNMVCRRLKVPISIVHYCSIWRIKFLEEYQYSELFFTLMRYKGIHILDGFPCYLTTAHSEQDIEQMINSFEESLKELKDARFIPEYSHPVQEQQPVLTKNMFNTPPLPNAKLGKDREGNPAWFVQDDENPGKYLQVN